MDKNEYYRKWRIKRKAQGLCVSCSNKAFEGRTYCSSCLKIRSNHHKDYYQKHKAEIYRTTRRWVAEHPNTQTARSTNEISTRTILFKERILAKFYSDELAAMDNIK